MINIKMDPGVIINMTDKPIVNYFNYGKVENHYHNPINQEPEVMEPEPHSEESGDREYCIVLSQKQRTILEKAEHIGLICYNESRKGFDKTDTTSSVLIAYLCGRLFCGDYADDDDIWIQGKRFEDAQYCETLFGFDVSNARRSAISTGVGKAPTGHKRIDLLFAD